MVARDRHTERQTDGRGYNTFHLAMHDAKCNKICPQSMTTDIAFDGLGQGKEAAHSGKAPQTSLGCLHPIAGFQGGHNRKRKRGSGGKTEEGKKGRG